MVEFILISIGLTFIIVLSYIFNKIRNSISKKSKTLGKLVKCTMCVGFHVGVLVKFLLMYYYGHTFIYDDIIIIVLYGFISSLCSYVLYLLIKPLIDKYD